MNNPIILLGFMSLAILFAMVISGNWIGYGVGFLFWAPIIYMLEKNQIKEK